MNAKEQDRTVDTMIIGHFRIRVCHNNGRREKPVMIRVGALLAVALVLAGSAGHAQTYPSRPITLIVPFAVGGSNDIVGRAIGKKLSEAWGQPVVVDNRAGAGGMIGSSAVAAAP